MKNLISIILIGLSIQYASAQEINISHFDKSYFQDTNTFELKDNLPNGIYNVYFDSLKTTLNYTGEIRNSKRINLWTWYYETGLKKREITYKEGLFHGQVISYYQDGQKSGDLTFYQGMQDGLTTRWYPNGKKKSEGMFKNGSPSGSISFWNEDGTVISDN